MNEPRDFSTDKMTVKCTERLAHGYTDPRAFFGTRDTRWYRIKCWWRDRFMPFIRRPLVRWRHARAKALRR